MFNALWLNAQELDGTGQLYKVILLGAAASPKATVASTPLYLRQGLAASATAGAPTSSVYMGPKRSFAVASNPGASLPAYPAMYPRVGLKSFVNPSAGARLGVSTLAKMYASVSTNIHGSLLSYTKFGATAAPTATVAAPVLRRTQMLASVVSLATSRSLTPPSLLKVCGAIAKTSSTTTATPDVKVGGSTRWALLAALPRPGATANVDISHKTNLFAKVSTASVSTPAVLSKVVSLTPAHVFATGFVYGAVFGGRRNFYGVQTVVTSQTTSLYRYTSFPGSALSAGAAMRLPVALSYTAFAYGKGSPGARVALTPLYLRQGMAAKSLTVTTSVQAMINVAWKFFAYAYPTASATVALTQKFATKLYASPAFPLTSASAAGYFTRRNLSASASSLTQGAVKAYRTVALAAAPRPTTSALVAMYTNLLAREPDFRTYTIDAEDWTNTIDQEDWTFTITDDLTNMKTFYKQPGDVLGYDMDFTVWFAQIPTDYIQSATCAITSSTTPPAGATGTALTITTVALINDLTGVARIAKVWVSGGISGVTYNLQLLMTSHSGRVKDVDFQIVVQEQ